MGRNLEFWDFLFEKGKRDLKIYSLKTVMVFLSQRIMSFAEDSEGTIWIGSF